MEAPATGNEGSFDALDEVCPAPHNWLTTGFAAAAKTPRHVVAAQFNVFTHGDQACFDAPATEYEWKATSFSTGHHAPPTGSTATLQAESEVTAADLARLAACFDTVLTGCTATLPRAACFARTTNMAICAAARHGDGPRDAADAHQYAYNQWDPYKTNYKPYVRRNPN